ncbi:MAG: hypothetical protein LBU23_02090, partial [Planctomycetota bacterium]|nr:hypothetical protein [Planctomycetota bacterium]
MLILAGIDEAGLGPTLGPLITASAALAVPDGWLPDSPWERLAGAVAKDPGRRSPLPVVADSKLSHRAGGIAALELSVGIFSLSANGSIRPPEISGADENAPAPHNCYEIQRLDFPVAVEPEHLARAGERLAAELRRNEVKMTHLETASLFEPSLNRRFANGLNKNQALLKETGKHLVRLVERFSGLPLLILVDKQGGRNDYLPFLGGLFPGVWLDVLETGAGISRYRLRLREAAAEIRFQAKADRDAFAVALASMAAKYVRERFMERLNAWFAKRLPNLRPTAGYP